MWWSVDELIKVPVPPPQYKRENRRQLNLVILGRLSNYCISSCDEYSFDMALVIKFLAQNFYTYLYENTGKYLSYSGDLRIGEVCLLLQTIASKITP